MNKLWMVLCKVFYPLHKIWEISSKMSCSESSPTGNCGETGFWCSRAGDISERIDEQIVHDVPVSQSLEVGGIRSFSMVQSRINEDSTKINKQGCGPQTLDTMRDDIDEKTCVRQAVEHGA